MSGRKYRVDKISPAVERAGKAILKAIRELEKTSGMKFAGIDVDMKRPYPVALSLVAH